MSIAEQIMLGTEQQSKNWSVLSENLGRLGQQVGQQLAMQEYRKQAAEALPAMQSLYKSAMDDVARGQTAEGYKKMMEAQFRFGGSQNPLIAEQAGIGLDLVSNYAAYKDKQSQRQAQYGGGGPAYQVPSMEELRSGETIPTRTVLPVFEVGNEDIMTEGGQPAGQPTATLLPEKQPLQGTPAQRAMQEADIVDQEATANLPSKGESPFEFGFRTGGVSRYVASEKSRKVAAEAFMNAVKATPEQRKATVERITEETEVIPENSFRANMPGFGDGYFVGPSMARGKEVKEQQVSEEFTPKGRKARRTETIGESELTDAQKAFQEATRTFGVATSMFRYNPQLSKIMEAAGGDPTKIQLDEENIETGDGKFRTVFTASVNGVGLGELSTETPLGPDGKPDTTALSELAAVRTMIGAPDLVDKFGGKFIPIKKKPAAQPAAPAGGERKDRFPVKKTEAPSSRQDEVPATPAKEMTLEERISAKTATPTAARKATPEQLAGVKAGQVRQQKSSLESEVTKLERALYDMPRTAGGKKQLKRGLSAQDPDVKAALQRIAEINKQLEAL